MSDHADDDHARKLALAAERGMRVVWSPQDFHDFARHAQEAIALTRQAAMNMHPVTISRRQMDPTYQPRPAVDVDPTLVFQVCRRAEVGDPAAAPEYAHPAPVVDMFTRQRVR